MSRKKDAKELDQDLQMLPKKDTENYVAKKKVIVTQLKTEENLMEE
jgi:hypothetical protein